MATRIKYHKTSQPGILKSVKLFRSQSTGAVYEVTIDLNDMSFLIRNINTLRAYRGSNDWTNEVVVKRNAKKRLESLGVKFTSEKGTRKDD